MKSLVRRWRYGGPHRDRTGAIAVVTSYAETGAFDVVLNHNRYTLVDRSAESLMELCANRKIGFINGAPYGGGILARGSAASSKYGYATAHPEVMRAVQAMEAACARYDVPLAAAALQFSLRTEIVGSTVVGSLGRRSLGDSGAAMPFFPQNLARARALSHHARPGCPDARRRGVRAGREARSEISAARW